MTLDYSLNESPLLSFVGIVNFCVSLLRLEKIKMQYIMGGNFGEKFLSRQMNY